MTPDPSIAAPMPQVEYVGFWARVGAALIDTCALLFLVVPLMVWYFGGDWAFATGLKAFTINYVLPALAVLLFWFLRGATPGKMAISAVIVDAHTLAAPSPAQLVGRYLGYYVSAIALGLGLVWVAFDARKQGWHDKMANTVVIRKRR
jgi:uncharacterized RDD family membrane protein YckC